MSVLISLAPSICPHPTHLGRRTRTCGPCQRHVGSAKRTGLPSGAFLGLVQSEVGMCKKSGKELSKNNMEIIHNKTHSPTTATSITFSPIKSMS